MPQLNVKGIKRVNEFADPEIIEQTEVTIFKNFVLDKEGGKAVKRGAYKSYNTNNPSGGLVLRSLHDVIDSAGANYLIGQSGTVFQKSLDGTGAWGSVKTGLTTGLKTRIATYNNRFFVTNGTDEVFETNLTTAWDLELDRPNVASVTTADSSGGSLDASARYRWMLVYITNKGEQSDVSIPIGHSKAADDGNSTDATNKIVTLSNLPVSSDTRVTGRKLYRTEGDGTTYYLLKYLDNIDTTFVDKFADTTLITSDFVTLHNTPTKAQHLAIHKNRLFLGNITKKTINNVFGKPAILPFIIAISDNGSAGLNDGVYKYKFSFLYGSGEESELSPEVSITLDKNFYAWTLGNTLVTITDIPQPRLGASDTFDSEVTKIRVYRTNPGGSIFYWLKDMTPSSTSYNITDIDNTTLSTAYPKSGYGGASTTALNSAVVFSEIDKPAEFPALNIFQIFPDDGDDIVGIFSEEDGLLIFKENTICKLYTQGSPYNWRLSKLYENRGCDTVGTIAESPQGYYFVNNKHVYRFPDNLITPISMPVKTTIEAATGRYHAEYISSLSWFIFL